MKSFILEENHFSASTSKAYEGLFAQGNGYLSVRGSFDEGLCDAPQNEEYDRMMKSVTVEIQRSPLSKWGVYVPLIMGYNPFLEEVILNLPYFMLLEFSLDGERVDLLHSRISNYHRYLDMKDGTLYRSFTVQTENGALVDFSFRRFASMAQKHLFVQQAEVRVREKPVQLKVRSAIDADVTTNGRRHFTRIFPCVSKNRTQMEVTTDLGFEVSMQSEIQADGWDWQENSSPMASAVCGENLLQPGTVVTFTKKSAVATSRDKEEDWQWCPGNVLDEASNRSFEELLEENRTAWQKKWENSDIQIEGDPELQKGIRFSMYHLLRSNMEDDCRVQICAKGFAGEAYYGRYFWDSEIYMLPFFLYTNPHAARNLILYRYHTLEGARKNAARYHCHGARYPWQSALDGTEQCSLWEYADNEVHITADVAYGVIHYYRATGDEEFLQQYGLEILLETARFWVDRVDRDAKGGYNLLNVMGPDEYSPMTRNNAYTNRLVIENLRCAVSMAEKARVEAPEVYEKLVEKIGLLPEELSKFTEIAELLPVPYDPERKLYLQSEDFESFADLDMDAIWTDRKRAFGHFATQEKIYRSKCLKQADVIALMGLFPGEFTDEQVKTAYEYYMPLTTHDSSLSPAAHSLVANRLGRSEDVDRFMRQSMAVDLDVEKGGSEDGIHAANCGCLWQLVVNSFAGMKTAVEQERLTVCPKLPQGITRIAFRVWWKGRQYQIEVTPKGGEITPVV